MFDTRDADVARRLGWSQAQVDNLRRLAVQAVQRAGYSAPRFNPWLSQARPVTTTVMMTPSLRIMAQVMPRVAGPIPSVLLEVAPSILELAGDALLGALSMRAAAEPHLVAAPGIGLPESGETPWEFPEGWTVTWCPGHSTAAAVGGFPHIILDPDLCGTMFGSAQSVSLDVSDETINATQGVAPGRVHSMWGPVVALTPFDRRREYRGNAAEPIGWTAGDPLPQRVLSQPVTFTLPAVDQTAPGYPAFHRVQLLGLPGMAPLDRFEPRAVAAEAAREALGLRSWTEALPIPEAAPDVRIEATPWDSAVAIEGTAAEAWPQPGRVFPNDAHTFTRVRHQAKIKVLPAYLAAKLIISSITETGDFIEQLWKALPRKDRTARLTESGNRRIDYMLRDLWRAWDRIEWEDALQNLQNNAVEDLIYGTLGMAAIAAGMRAGGSAVGWGTVMSGGQPYGGPGPGGSRLGPVEGGNPISWLENAVLGSQRRVRRDYKPEPPRKARGLQGASLAHWQRAQPRRPNRWGSRGYGDS